MAKITITIDEQASRKEIEFDDVNSVGVDRVKDVIKFLKIQLKMKLSSEYGKNVQ